MPTSPRTSPGSAAWQFVLPSSELGQGGDIACGSKTETEVLSDDDPRGVQRPEHGIDELGPSIRWHRDRRLDQRRLRYTTTAARQMAAAHRPPYGVANCSGAGRRPCHATPCH